MPTRRSLLGTAPAFAASLTGSLASGTARAQTPRDVAVMAKQIDDVISLDPAESFEYSGNEIGGNAYQRLVDPDSLDPARIGGDLAESWERGADGLTYTFRLRPGARFASGNPVTAEDAAFSLTRAVTLGKSPAFILRQFGWTAENAADRIRAADERTLVLRVAEPRAPGFLLYCLSANVAGVMEKRAVLARARGDDWGNAWLRTNSAGSGPFVVRAWRANEVVQLEANPYAARPPGVRRLIVRHVPDPAVQLLLLRAGDVDIARDLLPDQLAPLAGDPAYTLLPRTKASLMYLCMNLKHPALARPEARQAIRWAIDYDAIQRNIVPSVAEVHQAFLPDGFPAALKEHPFHKDTARARALLAGAGLADGFDVVLDHAATQPRIDIAQALQSHLGEAGIRVSLLAGDGRQVLTKIRARQHQLGLLKWGSDYLDPHSNADAFCANADNSDAARTTSNLAWQNAWADPAITAAARAALDEADTGRRTAAYLDLQRRVQQDGPYAILLQDASVAALRRGVSGLVLGTLSDRTRYDGIAKA